tara:strand:- start:157 stop:732 length:576 start_codon:yes stop_codon:yes gene_type:complete
MHYTFHHIPKTGGSSLRIRLEDRADKKQICKLDYAIGHNTTKRTPGTHFVWLRHPLARDISHFNYDMGKDEAKFDNFQKSCESLAGNFMTLWIHKNYLLNDQNVNIEKKYQIVRQCLKNNFAKVFCIEDFEDSWNHVADMLKLDREPRLNTNRSDIDYKKYADRKNLSEQFLVWHKNYNSYDYALYKEFCT